VKPWQWLALAAGAGAIVWTARKGYQLAAEVLSAVAPGLDVETAAAYAPALARAMAEASITTPARAAAFLAQIAFESDWFRALEEYASGSRYEDRADLGNVQVGDGVRYKGRGFIQVTGRRNYQLAGAALGLPLEDQPELASDPEVAARVAAWYWTSHNLNAKADAGDFVGITRAINGGTNGLDQRTRAWERAKAALGVA